MRKTSFIALLVCLAFCGTMAAAAKRPAKRVVLGTTQLKGDHAVIGTTYTLGKRSPINFTLNSAEYLVSRVRFGNIVTTTKPEEKLLVLHYTLHNPNKSDFSLSWNTLNFQAVDAKDTNWRYITDVGMDGTGEKCHMSLKPAQKTKLYVVIIVPAEGEIPKLVVESIDHLVLRYDLRGKVKRIPAPIADPADATGATALKEVPAEIGEFYPLREFDAKLDTVSFTTDPINKRAPKKDQRYMVFTVTAINETPNVISFGWNRFRPTLTDQDGGEVRWNDQALFASRDEAMRADVQPGKEVRCRYFFEVPINLPLKSFSIRELNGRAFVYDISSVK